MNRERLFRALLRLLPFDFRSDYGKEIEQTFHEQRRDARAVGRAREARIWWINIRDIIRTAPREHAAALRHDLLYALRGMVRQPGFAAVVVLTLALGLGANTAIFSLVHSVLLRPLPYPEPDRLVYVWNHWTGSPTAALSEPEYLDYFERNRTIDLAAMASGSVNLSDQTRAERVGAAFASTNIVDVLGIRPQLGRGFEPADTSVRAGRVAILTHAFWQSHFQGDRNLLGRTILVDSQPHLVVGIMPDGFRMPEDYRGSGRFSVLLPLVLETARPRNQRGAHYLASIGRLRPGISMEAARADLGAVIRQLIREYPEQHDQGDFGIVVRSARAELLGEARPVLLLLFAAVSLVLLIAGANVTTLTLARGHARRTELAVRSALGGSRYRLVRQLITENCVLFLTGALAGLAVAFVISRLVRSIDAVGLPRLDEVGLSLPTAGFALGLGLLAGLIFGVMPALHVSRVPVAESVSNTSRGQVSGGRSALRNTLVVAQVVLSMVLLVGAGLVVKSFTRLIRTPSGIKPENVLTLRLSLPDVRYRERFQVTRFFDELMGRIRALPGVRDAGAASTLPLAVTSGDWSFDVEGRPRTRRHHGAADWSVVTPGYFQSLGIRLIQGRYPSSADTDASEAVIFLNEKAARIFFPAGDALGQRIKLSGQVVQPLRRIAGIVGDVRQQGLDQAPNPQMYIPHSQFLHFVRNAQARSMIVTIRTTIEPTAVIDVVRREVRARDPDVPAAMVRTMEEIVASSVADRRLHLALIGAFAGLALTLALVGVYGLTAYHVSECRREIGVRMALGAGAWEVLVGVLRQGLTLVGVGMLLGAGAAYLASGAVERLLFDVSSTDLTVFAVVSLFLALTAVVACLIPALRATRLDPVAALR